MGPMTTTHQPVMDLIRASREPASRTASSRSESPACQIVTRAGYADAEAGGIDRLQLLASGTAVSATLLTEVLAKHREMGVQEVIDQFENQSARAPGADTAARMLPQVLRSLLHDDGMRGLAQVLAEALQEGTEVFCDLIIELGGYTAACVDMCTALNLGTPEEIFTELDEMLKAFVEPT